MPTPSRETVVDGYNLIHKLWRPGSETASMATLRDRLESMLSAYRKVARRHVTVVYDGGPGPGARSSSGAIEVVFSGSDRTADQHIVELVRNLKARAGLVTVVTSDREIRRHVIAWGASCSASESFIGELEALGLVGKPIPARLALKGCSPKKTGSQPLGDAEVEQWLKLFERGS
ncbi:MAG: NYN domain-containing protein [Chlorobiaceae bacterium]|nr:NYN domain-containing protein [Chlorobiaceae bacterium]